MWTVSVKTAQSELNESELHTNARTNEGSHATFLSLYIDILECALEKVHLIKKVGKEIVERK